jgi:hypothetical protein
MGLARLDEKPVAHAFAATGPFPKIPNPGSNQGDLNVPDLPVLFASPGHGPARASITAKGPFRYVTLHSRLRISPGQIPLSSRSSHNSEKMITSPIAVYFTRNTDAENSFGITS